MYIIHIYEYTKRLFNFLDLIRIFIFAPDLRAEVSDIGADIIFPLDGLLDLLLLYIWLIRAWVVGLVAIAIFVWSFCLAVYYIFLRIYYIFLRLCSTFVFAGNYLYTCFILLFTQLAKYSNPVFIICPCVLASVMSLISACIVVSFLTGSAGAFITWGPSCILILLTCFFFIAALNSLLFQFRFWFLLNPFCVFALFIALVGSIPQFAEACFSDNPLGLAIFLSIDVVVLILLMFYFINQALVYLALVDSTWQFRIFFFLLYSAVVFMLVFFSFLFEYYVQDTADIIQAFIYSRGVVTFLNIYSYESFLKILSYYIIFFFNIYSFIFIIMRVNIFFYYEKNKLISCLRLNFMKNYLIFLKISPLKKILFFFGLSKYKHNVCISRVAPYTLFPGHFINIFLFFSRLTALIIIFIYVDDLVHFISLLPEDKSLLLVFFIANTFRFIFCIEKSFLLVYFSTYKAQLTRSLLNTRTFFKNLFNQKVLRLYILNALFYAILFASLILVFSVLLLTSIYVLFLLLYDAELDFFFLTLVECELFYRTYGVVLILFGAVFSIQFIYWVLLLYFWKLPYYLWVFQASLTFVIVPFAYIFSDLNALNLVSNTIKYIFGNSAYRWGMFLRPPKPDPKDPDAPPLVLIGDWKWFTEWKFIFFEKLATAAFLPAWVGSVAIVLWFLIFLLLFILFKNTRQFILNNAPRNVMRFRHSAVIYVLIILKFYLFISFIWSSLLSTQAFYSDTIELMDYKVFNSQRIGSFIMIYAFSSLLIIFEAGFESVLPFLLLCLIVVILFWGILLFPIVFFIDDHKNYASILTYLDNRFKNVFLRGFARMTRYFYSLTLFFKINFIVKLVVLILINQNRSYSAHFSVGLSYYLKYLWVNVLLDTLRNLINISGILLFGVVIIFLSLPTFFCVYPIPLAARLYQFMLFMFLAGSYIFLYVKYSRNTHTWLTARDSIIDLSHGIYKSYRVLEVPQLSIEDRREFEALEGSAQWAGQLNRRMQAAPKEYELLVEDILHQFSLISREEADISWDRVFSTRSNIHSCYRELINWQPKKSGNYMWWKIATD